MGVFEDTLPPGFVTDKPEGSPLADMEAQQHRKALTPDISVREQVTREQEDRQAFQNVYTEQTKERGVIDTGVQNRLASLKRMSKAVNRLEESSGDLVEPGPAGNIRLTLGKVLGFVGFPQERLGDAALINKEGTSLLTEFFDMTKGAISDRETKIFQGATLGINSTISEMKQLIPVMQASGRRVLEHSKFLQKFARINRTTEGAEVAWERFSRENRLFNNDFSINKQNMSNWNDYIDPNFSKGETEDPGEVRSREKASELDRIVTKNKAPTREEAIQLLRDSGYLKSEGHFDQRAKELDRIVGE